MDYTTIEAEIAHGHISVREPERLPETGHALLIVLPSYQAGNSTGGPQERVRLPLVQGDGQVIINPTAEELDASLWD